MRCRILSAEQHYDDFLEAWTLECSLQGPYRTSYVLRRKDFLQLRRWIRHAPENEQQARHYAGLLNIAIDREEPVVLDSAQFSKVNVKDSTWKSRGEARPTKEGKLLSDKVDMRKVTIKATISRSGRTVSRCKWDLDRVGQALVLGRVARDNEGAEAIIGSKVLRYEVVEEEVEEEQADGTKKSVRKKLRVPVWDETEQNVGPVTAPIPAADGEHIVFVKEVQQLFRKSKNGKPFRIMDLDKAQIMLYISEGPDIEIAERWAGESIEKLPWISEYDGLKLEPKVFEK